MTPYAFEKELTWGRAVDKNGHPKAGKTLLQIGEPLFQPPLFNKTAANAQTVATAPFFYSVIALLLKAVGTNNCQSTR